MFLTVCYTLKAFTTDFEVHWAQHPLRPELVESTYFLFEVKKNTTFEKQIMQYILQTLVYVIEPL